MSELTPFAFGENLVRTLTDEQGNPWFVAKDVALALGYEWNGSARISHVPEEWRRVTSVVTPGVQEMLTLSEQGLYFFLGRSDKPGALPFQKWLAGEVLPALRRTGVYAMPRTGPALSSRSPGPALPELAGRPLPVEALRLHPHMRQKLWQDALQTARLDNAGSEAALRWFEELCRMVAARLPGADAWGLLHAFMDEKLEHAQGQSTSFAKIYAALADWWTQRTPAPVPGAKTVGTILRERFTRAKSNNSVFRNCRLRA